MFPLVLELVSTIPELPLEVSAFPLVLELGLQDCNLNHNQD
mgnify:CR=1 FL=1